MAAAAAPARRRPTNVKCFGADGWSHAPPSCCSSPSMCPASVTTQFQKDTAFPLGGGGGGRGWGFSPPRLQSRPHTSAPPRNLSQYYVPACTAPPLPEQSWQKGWGGGWRWAGPDGRAQGGRGQMQVDGCALGCCLRFLKPPDFSL